MPIHFEATFHLPESTPSPNSTNVTEVWIGDLVTEQPEENVRYKKWLDDFVHQYSGIADAIICQIERGEQNGRIHIQGHLIASSNIAVQTNARGISYPQRLVVMGRGTPFSTTEWRPSCNTVTQDFQRKRITIEQFYAGKEETRVYGPLIWQKYAENGGTYIPRQYREVTELYPWQKWVKDDCLTWNTRHIHIIMNKGGNEGKSWLCHYLRLCTDLKVFAIPTVSDRERLMADVCCKLTRKNCKSPNALFLDLPKAMPKVNLGIIFAAIEEIKTGHVEDTRYESHEWDFDCPNIYVFTNTWPDPNWLSSDRWLWHEIGEHHEIIHRDQLYVELEIMKIINEKERAKKRKRSDQESDAI